MTTTNTFAIAHDTGQLTQGTWICDCQTCVDLIADRAVVQPWQQFVIKGETGRAIATASAIVRHGFDFDAMATQAGIGYVREVWVGGSFRTYLAH